MDTDLTNADASFIGENGGDNSGKTICFAGDVNGDGYDDILVTSPYNDEGGSNAGQTYLIFGKSTGWSMDVDLSNADASFIGENAGDNSDVSAGVGDVNGDGYDDILISAHWNDEGGFNSGQAYLVFGKSSGWSMDTDLSSVDASFHGMDPYEDLGDSLQISSGDVNGDGYDDILIGAVYGDKIYDAGHTYLILGKSSGWSMDTDLSSADASFIGENTYDFSASTVDIAGDVNGDGYDDILIGSHYNDDGGTNAGQTYLIFGKSSGWSSNTCLSSADASFIGENSWDMAGRFAAGAGDVNGDGYDDIIIGAYRNDDGGTDAGQSYLILGKSSGWSMDTDLSNADASFWGEDSFDASGYWVSGNGDVNGDGYDDILIGAHLDDDGGSEAGQTYLILGQETGWSMDTDLSSADASYWGENAGDRSGRYVANNGDVNGDGSHDILISSYYNDEGGGSAGQTYLILGTEPPNSAPVACIGGPYTKNEGATVIFDASGSSDPENDPLQYRWDYDNDNIWDTSYSTSSSASFTWYDDYSGTVSVEVSDGKLTDTASTTVTITNVAPSVSFSTTTPEVFILPGENLTFQGTFTDPGTSDIHSIVWNFGDSNTASSGLTQVHSYTNSGTYTITLTITDDDGGIGTCSSDVTISSCSSALTKLIDMVEALNLQHGISNSLDSKLSNVKDSIEKIRNNNPMDAVNKLEAFINAVEAQSGKDITSADANELIELVERIIYALSN